jgi:hypothetical protein
MLNTKGAEFREVPQREKTINKLTDARVSYLTLSSLFFHAMHGMYKEKAIKYLSSS